MWRVDSLPTIGEHCPSARPSFYYAGPLLLQPAPLQFVLQALLFSQLFNQPTLVRPTLPLQACWIVGHIPPDVDSYKQRLCQLIQPLSNHGFCLSATLQIHPFLCARPTPLQACWILGHVPPVVDSYTRRALWQPTYARAFWRILSLNAGVVRAQLFGHVHTQEFRTWGSSAYQHDSGDMLEDVSSAPPILTFGAVSPIYNSNPVRFPFLVLVWARAHAGVSNLGELRLPA
jgi:hypothetical protein